MKRRTIIACIAAFSAALYACDGGDEDTDAGVDAGMTDDEDAGMDAGGGEQDAGFDAGPFDAGQDLGFTARLVNNIPGIAAVDICLYGSFEGAIIPSLGTIEEPGLPVTALPGRMPVPFRGVSDYFPGLLEAVPDVDYVVAMYDTATFRTTCGTPCTCPTDPVGSGAAFLETVTADQIAPGGTYTVIATGFVPGTFEAAPTDLPARCDYNPLDGPMYDQACDGAMSGARVLVVPDDLAEPALASNIKLRVSNQVPNSPPIEVHVCYDSDLVPDAAATEPGFCAEAANLAAPETLSTDSVAFGEVSDYAERGPIEPTTGTTASGAGGGIYLSLGVPCPAWADIPPERQRCYPILGDTQRTASAMFPVPQLRTYLSSGDIATIFISGVIGEAAPADPTMDIGSLKFLVWQDNYVAEP
jgi:hypothetical protein